MCIIKVISINTKHIEYLLFPNYNLSFFSIQQTECYCFNLSVSSVSAEKCYPQRCLGNNEDFCGENLTSGTVSIMNYQIGTVE